MNEEIFQMQAGAALPGGVLEEVEGVAGRLAVVVGNQALKKRARTKAVALQIGGRGQHCFGGVFVLGQGADEGQNQRRIGFCSLAERNSHGNHFKV